MALFIIRRIVLLAFILLAVSVLTFVIVNVLPGDVANAILGDMATPEQVAAVREAMGLNEPLVTRYLMWIGNILRGDFGTSLTFRRAIGPMVAGRLANSAILAGLLLALVIPLVLILGVVASLRPGSAVDRTIMALSVVGYALPEFVLGLTFILLFSIVFPILPGSSLVGPGDNPLADPIVLVLPLAVLVVHQLAHLVQITRASMIATLNSNFVRTAILKGLSRRQVVLKHALPNALPPVIAELGMHFGYVLGGLVVVETLFSYSGIGHLMVLSVETRDIPTLQITVLIIAAAYGVGNLLADLSAMLLNPKLRSGR